MAKRKKDLPYNENAEKTVIGSTLCSKEALYKVLSSLGVNDFYLPKHQLIYRAIISLQEKRLEVDSLTITEELQLMNQLEEAGGPAYLLKCVNCYISLSALDNYINIVKDNSDLRNLLLTIREIDHEYTNEPIDSIEDFIKSSQTKVRTCIESSRTSSFKSIETYTDEAVIKMENQKTSGDGYTTGITCGYENINKFTNGFQRGEVTVIGARSSVGKTALALNMAYKAAQRAKVPVAIFELEMTGVALAKRMLSMASGVESSKIETGKLSENEKFKIRMASQELKELPIYIDAGTGNTMMDIENKTRQLLDKCPNLGLVVVDHMSIVKVTGGKKTDTRVDEMRKISQGLHALAKELNVAILAVAQLNRDSVKGEVRRPKMSDIKESGAIEQDADVIILLFDALYENNKASADKKMEDVRNIEAIVAKQRNGRTGIANLIFFKQFSRFDMPTPKYDEELTKLNDRYLSM
jgi:replicative DNA helicase